MKNKKTIISFLIIFVVVVIFFLFITNKKSEIITLTKTTMNLFSPAFDDGTVIPSIYTCRGEGNHPPLEIGSVPVGTVSLAIVVDDPDAPSGDFTHWIVWNIDPKIREITDELPVGSIEGENSVGKSGYIAPCPPSGTHRYYFKLYALDIKPELSEGANKIELEKVMAGHIIDQTELVGLVNADDF